MEANSKGSRGKDESFGALASRNVAANGSANPLGTWPNDLATCTSALKSSAAVCTDLREGGDGAAAVSSGTTAATICAAADLQRVWLTANSLDASIFVARRFNNTARVEA